MNKKQKIVQQAFLNDEEKVIQLLDSTYTKALKDIQKEAKKLQKQIDTLDQQYKILEPYLNDEEKEKILSMQRSKVYQKKYQDSLEKQVSGILDTMHEEEFETVSNYLSKCYDQGFLGTMYDLQGQGIPLAFPIDQEAVVRAVQLDSKISKGLYTKLGEDIADLKKRISSTVSRGISTGMSFQQMAQQLEGVTNIGYNRAIRIARTEGHRIQVQSGMDACYKAQEVGAGVVKQWDATMDKRTRKSHQMVDGEIRELDEPFSNGLMFPSDPNGGAAEVINCRCALLQRARWALDDDELEALKKRAEFFGIDKNDSFEDFKKKYLDMAKVETQDITPPKKEYLTKKKLEQKLDDGQKQMDDLDDQFKKATGLSYDDFKKKHNSVDDAFDGIDEAYTIKTSQKKMDVLEKKYGGYDELWNNGSKGDQKLYGILDDEVFDAADELHQKGKYVDDFGDYDDIVDQYKKKQAAKKLSKEMDDLQDQMDDWQEKLDKKIISEETKKLKKQQVLLQDEIDDFEVKTYSGIWKNDVTTADWSKLNIDGKKKYYEGKFIIETDPVLMKKYQDLYKQLQELDTEGKKYYDLQMKLNQAKADLQKLQKNGKISSKDLDLAAFGQDRKDAALWFDRAHGGFSAADKYFDPPALEIYKNATQKEFNGFYTYTSGSGGHNRPLAGFRKPWSKAGSGWEDEFFVGAKDVWIDFEGKGEQIRGLTTLIEKSTYDKDVWLQSGQDHATLEGFLGIPKGTLRNMNDAQLQQFVGRENVIYNFISTAVNEGGGSIFNSKPMKLNIYAPEGTQMLYASNKGAFGKGENEMILQRGGTYKITKIYWGKDVTDGGRMKIMVDMEVHPEKGYDLFQQDPSEWKGSKKNYRD